jgi:hypothetical protein
MSDEQSSDAAGPVPYKCAHYPDDKTNCVKYYYDPDTQRWDKPQFGEPCACSDCKYWMSEAEVQDLLKRGLLRRSPNR